MTQLTNKIEDPQTGDAHPQTGDAQTGSAVVATEALATASPRCDIVETATQVLLVAEMPGVDQQGVSVQLEDGVLWIRGTPTGALPGATAAWSEFELTNFERCFRLSDAIDPDGIHATIANGLLRVELEKKRNRTRTISVQTG